MVEELEASPSNTLDVWDVSLSSVNGHYFEAVVQVPRVCLLGHLKCQSVPEEHLTLVRLAAFPGEVLNCPSCTWGNCSYCSSSSSACLTCRRIAFGSSGLEWIGKEVMFSEEFNISKKKRKTHFFIVCVFLYW